MTMGKGEERKGGRDKDRRGIWKLKEIEKRGGGKRRRGEMMEKGRRWKKV